MREFMNLIEGFLSEKVIRMDADGHPISVVENPNINQVLNLLSQSPDEMVKGLIIGSDIYFWSSASKATHGHVAERLWPTDGKRVYWEYPEYVDNRLIIRLDDGYPTLDFDYEMLNNPRILSLLKSDKLYVRFPGAGFMNYSEFVENEKRNEKRCREREAQRSLSESYVITDNPAFKSWFAGSKVVDKADNPLRAYHSTFLASSAPTRTTLKRVWW